MTTTGATATARSVDDDLLAFRRDGFVVVKGLFAGEELAALQREAAAQIDAGAARGPAAHFVKGTAADGSSVLFRIEAVLSKLITNDAPLLALAHPRLLELAARIVGGPAVCWSDALLWKGPDGGAAVGMHSAFGWHDPNEGQENLVVDVYLDEATPANGCLRVIPGSHLLTPEENRALVAKGFDHDGLVDVVLEPGDVLFHSEWMVHGSFATGHLGKPTRRILYYAFRSPFVFAPEGSSLRRHRRVARALRRMQLAQERRAAAPYAGGETALPIEIPAPWRTDVDAVDDSEAYSVGWFYEIGLD